MAPGRRKYKDKQRNQKKKRKNNNFKKKCKGCGERNEKVKGEEAGKDTGIDINQTR